MDKQNRSRNNREMAERKVKIMASEDRGFQKAYRETQDGATCTRNQAVRLDGWGYAVPEIMNITGCSRTSMD